MTPTERNAVLEEAARACERPTDWSEFGNGIGQWEGGPDASLDYKMGIVAARAHSAAAIRALKEQEPTT